MHSTMQDLTVILADRPGTLAKATEAVAGQGINIEGLATIRCGDTGVFHVLLKNENDATSARKALERAGFKIDEEQPVVVVNVDDRPGMAAGIFRAIANAGANVTLTYLATNTRTVIGADDIEKVSDVLSGSSTAATTRR